MAKKECINILFGRVGTETAHFLGAKQHCPSKNIRAEMFSVLCGYRYVNMNVGKVCEPCHQEFVAVTKQT